MAESIEVKVLDQHIKEDMKTDLDQDSGRVKRWYTNNVILRRLAYLVAFTEAKIAKSLRCTAAGVLKVALTGSGFTEYTTNTGVGAAAYAAGQTHEFTEFQSEFDVLIEVFDAVLSFKKESGAWGADIIVPVGTYEKGIVANGVRFRNRSALNNTVYEVQNFR